VQKAGAIVFVTAMLATQPARGDRLQGLRARLQGVGKAATSNRLARYLHAKQKRAVQLARSFESSQSWLAPVSGLVATGATVGHLALSGDLSLVDAAFTLPLVSSSLAMLSAPPVAAQGWHPSNGKPDAQKIRAGKRAHGFRVATEVLGAVGVPAMILLDGVTVGPAWVRDKLTEHRLKRRGACDSCGASSPPAPRPAGRSGRSTIQQIRIAGKTIPQKMAGPHQDHQSANTFSIYRLDKYRDAKKVKGERERFWVAFEGWQGSAVDSTMPRKRDRSDFYMTLDHKALNLVQPRSIIGYETMSEADRLAVDRRFTRASRYLDRMFRDIELHNPKTGQTLSLNLRSVNPHRFKRGRLIEGQNKGWRFALKRELERANTEKITGSSSRKTIAHELAHVLLGLTDEYYPFQQEPPRVYGDGSLMSRGLAPHRVLAPHHLEALVLPLLRELTQDANWTARWRKGSFGKRLFDFVVQQPGALVDKIEHDIFPPLSAPDPQ
jgi:hypothetical protein